MTTGGCCRRPTTRGEGCCRRTTTGGVDFFWRKRKKSTRNSGETGLVLLYVSNRKFENRKIFVDLTPPMLSSDNHTPPMLSSDDNTPPHVVILHLGCFFFLRLRENFQKKIKKRSKKKRSKKNSRAFFLRRGIIMGTQKIT